MSTNPMHSGLMSTPTDFLSRELFEDGTLHAYAVLDGAAIPGLLDVFAAERPEQVCLYRGELGPDLAECAPYLVRLRVESAFTRWLMAEGQGKPWGIFVKSGADMNALRRHFRSFLLVVDPNERRLYFRFYDPRVLRLYLPTCNEQEVTYVFGPVSAYVFAGEAEGEICVAEVRERHVVIRNSRANDGSGSRNVDQPHVISR